MSKPRKSTKYSDDATEIQLAAKQATKEYTRIRQEMITISQNEIPVSLTPGFTLSNEVLRISKHLDVLVR
jgi:hypothetical protein